MVKKKIFILIDEVELFLKNHKVLRDSDERLMANIWAKHIGIDTLEYLNAKDILTMLSTGKLPSYESISRCRRKLQEEMPDLRGQQWLARQEKMTKEIKKELESFNGIRKKINKAKIKRTLRRTPYPVGFEYKKERR
tara:strand:- start:409 stop:819 length:411 start_codon:yes stop_codon:yes gene_type:complete